MGAMGATYVPTTGQLETTTLSGVLATCSYDPFGDLAGIRYEDGGAAVSEVMYTRDSSGCIETKMETHSGSTNLRCYEYDDAERLADVYDATFPGVFQVSDRGRLSWKTSKTMKRAFRALVHRSVNLSPCPRFFQRAVLVTALSLALGCSVGEEDVADAVETYCPQCRVVEWYVGEGDGAYAYVHVSLMCRGDSSVHKQVWQFRSTEMRWKAARVPSCGDDGPRPGGGVGSAEAGMSRLEAPGGFPVEVDGYLRMARRKPD